jgi:hypothetical protein
MLRFGLGFNVSTDSSVTTFDPDDSMRANANLIRRDAKGGVILSFEIPKARRAPTSRAYPSIQRRREAFDDMKRRISWVEEPKGKLD